MAETNIKDVKLKIGTEAQFQDKLKNLPINTLVGVTDPIQEGELDTSIINKLDKAENSLPKPANDSTGTAGQVLKKTEGGSEWGDETSTTFKTLFGNQSITGSGNIDLYNHDIEIGGIFDGNVISITFNRVSSKNIVVDSINDLITLLGNKFRISVSGFLDTSNTGSLQGIDMLSTTDGGGYLRFHIGVEDYAVADIQTLIITDIVTTV